jgi:DNA-binding NarL/FixJ family response regulator
LQGQSSKEIASQLGLSVRTVENHRARLMEKLHVKSAIELVKAFVQST